MSKFKIRHITRYTYEDVVSDSANQIMLYPVWHEFQETLSHNIVITGNPIVNIHQDYYGNRVGTFTLARPNDQLIIDSQLLVNTHKRPAPADDKTAEVQWSELEKLQKRVEFIDFLKLEKFTAHDEIEKIVEEERCKNCTPVQSAFHFCKYIFDTFTYRKGVTTVETTLDEVWRLKSGVCQDFAHMLLVMLRMIHIPSRYVSGYVCPNKNGMRGEGATHAWVEAYIPFFGWLGLDPTNNCLADETHVKLAVGKNFSDCSPVKGTYRGTSKHTLEVSVSVSYEDGQTSSYENEIIYSEPTRSEYQNSFRKNQEMQQQ
jgi:transglutaminase-like putative cysteine protease